MSARFWRPWAYSSVRSSALVLRNQFLFQQGSAAVSADERKIENYRRNVMSNRRGPPEDWATVGAQQILEGEGRKEYPSEAPEKLVTNRIKAEML